jgi:dihydroxyacetone kinase-like protein
VLKQAQPSGEDFIAAIRRSVAAVEAGMKATIPMLATKGRASYLGERSIGHQDPGATSVFYIAQALLETIESIQLSEFRSQKGIDLDNSTGYDDQVALLFSDS